MKIDFPVEAAVLKRYSVRNYSDQKIEEDRRKLIEAFVESLNNPFGAEVKFIYLDELDVKNEEKLGTYGVIKGAKQYIGATIKAEPLALEALGYELEALILYLAHLGLGTCWLGGTFNRKAFANAMNIGANEIFPIITPYGYPAAKKHMKERMMRTMIRAEQRKDFEQLFFKDDFGTPLSEEEMGELAFPLKMLRLGPSASNKQPWRVLLNEGVCHFYEDKAPGYSEAFSYDIQRVDMGIAAAHFDFAAQEIGLKGHFDCHNKPELDPPAQLEYVFSWVRE